MSVPATSPSSTGIAASGPSYRNPVDGALILSNGSTVSVESVTGDVVAYMSGSDSFMLLRAKTGERLGSLGNGVIGLDEGRYEAAVETGGKTPGQVLAYGPSEHWISVGSIYSADTQKSLGNLFDPQAVNDFNQTFAKKGALGWINLRELGLDKTSIDVLNLAQALNLDERKRAARAATDATAARDHAAPDIPVLPVPPYDPSIFGKGFPVSPASMKQQPPSPKTPPSSLPKRPLAEAPGNQGG